MSAHERLKHLDPALVPESPTTARPLEMDDDDHETNAVARNSTTSTPHNLSASSDAAAATVAATAKPAPADETPPPKPPRPMTEAQKNMAMLKEAFPTIDEPIIKAVLTASRGQVESAFTALLQMTDPEAAKDDDLAPPLPPKPSHLQGTTGTIPMTQLEADELYARQLAEQFENSSYEARTSNRASGQDTGHHTRTRRQQQPQEREYSFIDDELPVIKENLRKGFVETQSKLSEWLTAVKKKIDGEDDDTSYHDDGPRPGYGRAGRQHADRTRRDHEYDRYDADPQVLSDDFAGMKLNSDGTPAGRRGMGQMGFAGSSSGVYRPPPKSTPSSAGRKVAFSEQPEEIEDEIFASGPAKSRPGKDTGAASKNSKWQPLSTVAPDPISDSDPFSLGESDDEKESKDKPPVKGETVQKPAAPARSENTGDKTTAAVGTSTTENHKV